MAFSQLAGSVAGGPATPGALVARVLPDVAGFDRELDYEVPARLAGDIRPGTIVRVPLQGRRVRGWVVAYPVEPPEGIALRPLAKVTGWGPEAGILELASWAAWRWAGRRRSFLVTASPKFAVPRLVARAGPGATASPALPRSSRPLPVAPATATTTGAAGGVGGDDHPRGERPGISSTEHASRAPTCSGYRRCTAQQRSSRPRPSTAPCSSSRLRALGPRPGRSRCGG